jgi:hypothetical protein
MKFETYVKNAVANLQQELNLQHWEIIPVFEETHDAEDYAETHCNSRYHRARIKFTSYLRDHYAKGDLERVQKIILHELVHVMTEEVNNYGWKYTTQHDEELYTDMLEQQTEQIARAFHKLIPKRVWP